jgi:hypothetical protein
MSALAFFETYCLVRFFFSTGSPFLSTVKFMVSELVLLAEPGTGVLSLHSFLVNRGCMLYLYFGRWTLDCFLLRKDGLF